MGCKRVPRVPPYRLSIAGAPSAALGAICGCAAVTKVPKGCCRLLKLTGVSASLPWQKYVIHRRSCCFGQMPLLRGALLRWRVWRLFKRRSAAHGRRLQLPVLPCAILLLSACLEGLQEVDCLLCGCYSGLGLHSGLDSLPLLLLLQPHEPLRCYTPGLRALLGGLRHWTPSILCWPCSSLSCLLGASQASRLLGRGCSSHRHLAHCRAQHWLPKGSLRDPSKHL